MSRFQHSRLSADQRRRLARLDEAATHRAVQAAGHLIHLPIGPCPPAGPGPDLTYAEELARARTWVAGLTASELSALAHRLGTTDGPELVAEWRRLYQPMPRRAARA